MFKIKIKDDEKVIVKARLKKIDELEDIFDGLKKKYKGGDLL